MIIRMAKRTDAGFLYNLRNEEQVRAVSWRTTFVDTEEHLDWFDRVLEDPNRVLYILEENRVSVGQVRYDVEGETAEVSISVPSHFCGRGYGTTGLKETVKIFFESFPKVSIIFAHIKLDNIASIRIFEKAGYKNKKIVNFEGHECVEMTLSRP